MFKIARTGSFTSDMTASMALNQSSLEMISQFCVSEAWSGDLSNGLLSLGEKSAEMHGLRDSECGLLNLVRCYDNSDRSRVLELFEKAATTSSSFCYSTTIVLSSGHKQPVFCVGESSGLEQRYTGALMGMFFFPKFQIEPRNANLFSRQ